MSYAQQQNSFGDFHSYNSNTSMRQSNKSLSLQKGGDDSSFNLGYMDMSFGSILGNLNKSRNGSLSKCDPTIECQCGYKVKYTKCKSINDSLKSQLQIAKE